MSNVQKFNENLFTEWSLMTFSDYEKEYSKKFKRTSKNIKKYYECYVELYNSDSESSSDEETDNGQERSVASSCNTIRPEINVSVKIEEKKERYMIVKPPNPSNMMVDPVGSNAIRGKASNGVANNNLVNTNTAISSFFMEFNGFKIRQRPSDGYIHATDMCKVGKKLWAKYSENKLTKNFIKQLSADIKKPISELFTSIKGGNDKNNQGTWIHPRIAINLAQWISSEFAVKVSKWVMEWSGYNEKNKQELLYSLSNLKPNEAQENKEQIIQLKLQKELGGEIEVEYEGDFIDLLTDTEIIEIKTASKWKHALGQLLVYSDGFPNHKKRLHLFEKDDVDYKRIQRHCDNFNVKVTYE
jgi:hypothetical protein